MIVASDRGDGSVIADDAVRDGVLSTGARCKYENVITSSVVG